ncbi:unnamed protein product [Adineta ricciae]|uniref:Kinesin motor domain-containing protein n=1 Tax=Adineta ricciae TaxID=249248 RepID=A0A813X631_ADIRI|nr:unnamed protein product [Adineta ricciae]CAF1552360.1 unnamed protein product [Adineta ricciae]
MPKAAVERYSFIEIPATSESKHLQIPTSNDDLLTKNCEPYPPEHGVQGRIRFLEPNQYPQPSRTPRNIPSLESLEMASFETMTDLHQDGPNSVSRGLQTDINSASVIDWVIAQKSSSTADSVYRNDPPEELGADKARVRVVVRVRPMNSRELERNDRAIIQMENDCSLMVQGAQHNRRFTFDSVFQSDSTQEDIFQNSGIKRLVDMSIEGYITTCFAYGQTGSGKTHTMIGPGGASVFRMDENYRIKHFGLVPRAINYLFQRLREKSQENHSPYYIRVSYCEIYNEQIHDLINPAHTQGLQIRGSVEDGFYVENLFQTYIETMDELLTILEEGELNRAMASHNLNDTSSRSHAMLSIQVEQDITESENSAEQMTRQGKLIFVDLAGKILVQQIFHEKTSPIFHSTGSEKVKVSLSKGKQLIETNNINKSLLTLGTCISALSDPVKRAGHIPYRDSKLTRLLADSLGGHGITLMLACVSPSHSCESETLSTLRYANRAKNIENAPIVKTDSKENVINRLKREVRKLKDENYELRQKLGSQSSVLPKLKLRHTDSGSQSSIRSSASSDVYDSRQDNGGRLSGTTTRRIRTDHELLTRENEKLVRKLDQVMREQQAQPGGKQNHIHEQESNPPDNHYVGKNARESDEEMVQLSRRPSYTSRYRNIRDKNQGETSPQRRTTNTNRRGVDAAAVDVRR